MLVGCLLSDNPCPCEPCVQHSSGLGSCWLPFSAFPHYPSWTCGGESSPVCCGVVKSERLEPWELAVAPLPSFLGVAFEEPLWLLLPPPLLGLPSRTPVVFLEGNPRHTFLWVCSAEEETNACFRHRPQL